VSVMIEFLIVKMVNDCAKENSLYMESTANI